MSLKMPARRLLQSAAWPSTSSASSATGPGSLLALQHLSLSSWTSLPTGMHNTTQRRTLSLLNSGGYTKKEQAMDFAHSIDRHTDPVARFRNRLRGGRVEGEGLFSDEVDATQDAHDADFDAVSNKISRDKTVLARSLNPNPRAHARFMRKMVIRHVETATNPYSREKREARIKRTEKEICERSGFKPTSVKKLVHLSRQIAGKTVDEALTQMRYSKKKMAKEIYWSLEHARDRAIVERGMGLGKVNGEADAAKPEQIQTKDGRHLEVTDATTLYVAQSWVERGPWRGVEPNYRARGRVDKILKPSTGVGIILKEQRTLVREHKEREEKKYRQGPWEHHPNRPVTAQHQHYSW